jgi:hypothetical protein
MHKKKSWLDSIKKEADRRPFLTFVVVLIVYFAVMITTGNIVKNTDPTCTPVYTNACVLNVPL